MRKENFSKRGVWFFVISALTLIVALNLSETIKLLSDLIQIISPFLVGFAIAFLFNIPMMFFEKKVFSFMDKKNGKLGSVLKKLKRPLSFSLTLIIVYLVFSTIGSFIYREVAECVSDFAKNASVYANHLQSIISSITQNFSNGFLSQQIEKINWVTMIEKMGTTVASISPNIINWTIGLTSAIFNLVMAAIFALYLLFGKERILRHTKRTMYAYLRKDVATKIRKTALVVRDTFTKFTVGQLTETLILASLYFIATSIAKLPYPALISILMGIGGIIPVFGPIIAAVPSLIIVLMVSGIDSALVFVIMAVIIQQLESNVIYPKVIGDTIGLPAIWVLLSVLIGSAAGGMVGMILSVPTASVIYKILRKDVKAKLEEKQISDIIIDGDDI